MIKNLIQEGRKSDLSKKLSSFGTIGSFEDFVSLRFNTVIVSLVRTKSFAESGEIYNSQQMIDFLFSRLQNSTESALPAKIIVISKASALNDLWKDKFYSAPNVTVYEF